MMVMLTCSLHAGLVLAAPPANYDEAKVPAYTLADPLVCADGTPVLDAAGWANRRRPEILELFRSQMYGRSPAPPAQVPAEVLERVTALDGKAIRKQIRLWPTGDRRGPSLDLLVYLPAHATGPVPVTLGLNFGGNQSIHHDPGIRLNTHWMRSDPGSGVADNHATEASRGTSARRWPVELVLSRGYALATAYYGDLEPDHATGWKTGIRGALSPAGAETMWRDDDWGAIAANAWGLSRIVDYLQTDREVDAHKVLLHGHSRLGKAALWAGAEDPRFAIVVSNCSGEGGAALMKRRFGETVAAITGNFPHWFNRNFNAYIEHEERLPMDAHELIALIAPRPVYVASASEDLWADPRGEFLAAKAAEPVYALFGKAGLGTSEPPAVNTHVGDTIGYHRREGKHDQLEFDWRQYLDFADRHLATEPTEPGRPPRSVR